MPRERPWQVTPGGLIVMVRATPRGGRDAIDGTVAIDHRRTAVKARVRAAPADGEANRSVVRLLAASTGIAPSAVTLLQGAAGRIKTFRLTGDPAKLAAALERATALGKERK